jgi:hypothetical protein
LEIFGYIAAGSLMKLTDEIADSKSGIESYKWISILSGIIYGSIIGLLISHSLASVYVLGAIIIGCLVTGKVDARGHYLALASILLIILALGVKSVELINPSILLLVAFSSVIDEIANDRYRSFRNKAVKLFFKYRMTMKVLLLALSIPQILSYYPIIFLLIFDCSYYLTDVIWGRLIR